MIAEIFLLLIWQRGAAMLTVVRIVSSSNSYQTLCNSLGAQPSLQEAIENMRWKCH